MRCYLYLFASFFNNFNLKTVPLQKKIEMKFHYCLVVFLLAGLNFVSCQTAEKVSTFRAAFYNVENLFDLVDDPIGIDEEFLPEGKKKWTQDRYEKKLTDLGKVINSLEYPGILGVCEVENRKVLSDLIAKDNIKDVHYEIVHGESPDMRGIDVGLLFDKDLFTLDSSSFIRVLFPKWLEPEGYTSRDIVYAKLSNKVSETFHVFVNHWPSRRGGQEASEKRRLWVASHLQRAVGRVLNNDNNANIIIMGDFNDEASNTSISQTLGAIGADENSLLLPGLLYNYFLSLEQADKGSYNYRGDWNMLDQIIIGGFDQTDAWNMNQFGIFKEDWLLYKGDKGDSPSKTYGGPNYYGGYSDHLPVYMDFEKKNSAAHEKD